MRVRNNGLIKLPLKLTSEIIDWFQSTPRYAHKEFQLHLSDYPYRETMKTGYDLFPVSVFVSKIPHPGYSGQIEPTRLRTYIRLTTGRDRAYDIATIRHELTHLMQFCLQETHNYKAGLIGGKNYEGIIRKEDLHRRLSEKYEEYLVDPSTKLQPPIEFWPQMSDLADDVVEQAAFLMSMKEGQGEKTTIEECVGEALKYELPNHMSRQFNRYTDHWWDVGAVYVESCNRLKQYLKK